MKRIGLALIAFALAAASCSKNDNPVSPESFQGPLSGIVYNQDGMPIPNVGVHYIFELNGYQSLGKPGGTCPSTTIGYTIPAPCHVMVRLLRWYTFLPVDTLFYGDQPAGYYRQTLDLTHIDNGVYLAEITAGETVSTHMILVQNVDLSTIVQTSPLTSTDANGRFSIPYGMFGFGAMFAVTSTAGPSIIDSVGISSSISLVLFKEGYQPLIRPVTIDTTKAMAMTFTLTR
jgi:hypothetical protein